MSDSVVIRALEAVSQQLTAVCDWLGGGSSGVTVHLELGVCQLAAAALVLVGVGLLLARRLLAKKKVYVLDFAVHKPHER